MHALVSGGRGISLHQRNHGRPSPRERVARPIPPKPFRMGVPAIDPFLPRIAQASSTGELRSSGSSIHVALMAKAPPVCPDKG